MSRLAVSLAAIAAAALLAGCTSPPVGPSVAVMPAPNKPFEVFAQDTAICRQFADQQLGGPGATENEAATRGIGSAIVGTALGAGLGAAVGGPGGAAIGAASGAVAGTAVGIGSANATGWWGQHLYDTAYAQCMYAKGNQLPGAPLVAAPPPPPPSMMPPSSSGGARPVPPVTTTPLPPSAGQS